MLFGSIKTKIMLAIVLCSVLTVSLVGFASWYSSKQMIEEQMYQNAQYLVENKAKDLNNTIEKIESSVDYLSVAVLSMLDDVEKFKTDDGYIYSLQEKVRPIAENIAKETNGAMAFYVRFNPDYSAPTSGLFHADTDGDGTIEQLTPTDFSQYDPNDLEHVGWYYIPVKAGKPTWMDPYRNENIGVDMISYVIPLEKGGESIGVVGMDINFQLFTDVVGQIKPYEHSFAALLNSAQHYLIHPAYTAKENLSNVDAALFEQLGKSESGVIRLQKEANEIVSYAKLSNGFTLTVTSAEADVYHALNQLTGMLLVILGGVFLLALLIAFWTGNRLFRPLRRLVSDMEKVKDGDLTVRTPIQTRDEMALIGTQFNRMVEELGHLTKSIHLVSAEIKTSSEALAAFSEEVTASSEEMSASVEEIADGNRQQSVSIDTCVRITSDLSHKFQELQDETGGVVSQLDGMNGENRRTFELIRQLEEKTARNEQAAVQIEAIVTQLKQQAQSISDIMGTISGIADQTNLLALNASIESARAGEWGRGFAVVADEIRKLAEQSKQASDHIQRIVMAVQENSYQTVDAMQEVKASTGEQVQAARDVSEAVSTMSATIHTIAKKIEQHGQIVTGLGANAAQLVSEMEYISSIAQESAASSSQVAAVVHQQVRDYETVTISAERMNQMVAELGGTVSKFIVEGELSPIPRA